MRPAVSSSSGSGLDTWVVIAEEGIVTGLRRGDSLAEDPDTSEEDVMELGQRPIRPSTRVETLLGKRSSQGVTSWLVTASHGVLLGVFARDDAERALEELEAKTKGAER
jgi:hypothetical protein